MELDNAVQFLCNRTILITGATGFLGKLIVEKILRSQPNVEKLYLLIRSTDTKSAEERFQDEVISKDLYDVVRDSWGSKFGTFILEKVHSIAGDTSLSDLGLNGHNICKEIDAIIHVAATTNFNERYDLAFGINTLGARNVIHFAKKCPNLQVFVHVSTAYVCGEETGLIHETPCKIGKTSNGKLGLDIHAESILIDNTLKNLGIKGTSAKEVRYEMKKLGQKRARLYGWPNTYVFTKAMGEMLVNETRGDLPIVIVRPTMVGSTYKEPFPGWIDNFGSIALFTFFCGKGLADFVLADGNSILDLIPADMVVNSIITAMVANANKPSLTIYQVGSSLRNPITYRGLLNNNMRYFKQAPWINEQGLPVKIVLKKWPLVKYKAIFYMLLAGEFVKLMVLKMLNLACFGYLEFDQIKLQKLKITWKIADTFAPYMLFSRVFDDTNTEMLRMVSHKHGKDEENFCFDPNCIDWNHYLLQAHIPAIVKYLF